MTHTISKLLAMAVIAVGAVTALPSVSPAQSLDLYIGPRGDDGDYRDYRRYDDERDNAMNIGEWLPVTATFSACLQNNHHHYPTLARLGHAEGEYDFGFLTIRMLSALGLVRSTPLGARVPPDVALSAPRF